MFDYQVNHFDQGITLAGAFVQGPLVVQLLILLFLLAAIAKFTQVASRSDANTLCLLSAVLVLSTLLLGGIGRMMINAPPHISSPLVMVIGVLVLLGFFLVSFILGVIGLVQFTRHKGRYQVGPGYGMFAISISCIAFVGVLLTMADDKDQIGPRTSSNGQYIPHEEFEDLNFRFTQLARPWVPVDPARFNEDVVLAYQSTRPEIYLLMVAEKNGIESNLKLDQLIDVSKENIRSGASRARFSAVREYTINGLKGKRFFTDATVSDKARSYVHWLYEHNGYAYQLIAYGRVGDRDMIRAIAEHQFNRFSLIDNSRIAHSQGFEPFDHFTSERYGYAIDLTGQGWSGWPGFAKDFPLAGQGVMRGNHLGLVVVPLYMGRESPLELLTQAMLSSVIGYDYPDQPVQYLASFDDDVVSGHLFSCSQLTKTAKRYYRVKIVQGSGCAYMVFAWTDNPIRGYLEKMGQAINSVEIHPPDQPLSHVSLTVVETKRHATILNQIGRSFFLRDQTHKAIDYFSDALRYRPEHAPYLNNLIHALVKMNRHAQALSLIEQDMTTFKEVPSVMANYAWLLSVAQRNDEAIATYQQLFDEGYRHDDDVKVYLDLLSDADKLSQAIRVVEQYRGGGDSPDMLKWHALLLAKAEQYHQAINMLKEYQSFNPDIMSTLADIYLQANLSRQALKVINDLIERGYDSSDYYYQRGMIQFGLKWYRKAQESFEIAIDLSPTNTEARKYLEHISGLLGQGDNSAIRVMLDPIDLPAPLLKLTEQRTTAKISHAQNAYYDYIIKAVQYLPDQPMLTTTRISLHVLDANSVNQFSTLTRHFDPLTERVYVNRLAVYDERDQLVAEGQVDDYYVADQAKQSLATHDKTLYMPVPGLKPGYRIELILTRQDIGDATVMPFQEHLFSRKYPVGTAALYVCGQTEDIAWQGLKGQSPVQLDEGMYWQKNQPTVFYPEPLQPDLRQFLDVLVLGDKNQTWANVANEYLQRIQDRLDDPGEASSLARRLVAGSTSELQKIQVISRYVQEELTYKAIEFGTRAQIMNKFDLIHSHRYGDCKDHSLMLWHLLNQNGIKANLAVVNTDSPVESNLPALDQFNHMVIYLPTKKGGRVIDLTDKQSDPLAKVVPAGLGGRHILVLDSDKPRLMKLPDYSPNSSQIHISRQIQVEPDGDVEVTETIKLEGYYASSFRRLFGSTPPDHYQQLVTSELVGTDTKLRIHEIKVEQLDQVGKPFILKMSYTVGQALHPIGNQMVGRMPSLWESYYIVAQYLEDRKTPFDLEFPFQLSAQTTVVPPSGYKLSLEKFDTNRRQSPFANWQIQQTITDGNLLVSFWYTRKTGLFKAQEYSRYQQVTDQVDSAAAPGLVFVKKK